MRTPVSLKVSTGQAQSLLTVPILAANARYMTEENRARYAGRYARGLIVLLGDERLRTSRDESGFLYLCYQRVPDILSFSTQGEKSSGLAASATKPGA